MSRRAGGLLVLVVGLALAFAMMSRNTNAWTSLISAGYPRVRWVEPETLEHWMQNPDTNRLVLLDVRSPAEQSVSQLRGARRVDARRPNVSALEIPNDATVVVYCSIGLRSAAIVEELEAIGNRNVYNLEGGIFDWANRGRPLVRGEESVTEVHPYNGFWGMLVRGDRRAAD